MCNATLRRPYDAEHVCDFVHLVYADRVVYFDDRVEVAPGLFAHHVGGHTPGLSMVEVPTARGTVVVASDAMHFYDNAKLGMPYPVLVDLPDYFAAIKQAYSLAASPDHVIPGHDPVVMDIYPPVSTELADLAVRLDVDPTPAA
jgi:glyoxylase-like metal-dependent hydrolase (beta-lactamase superfamily II)